jgi:hypothetical protein
MKSTYEKQEHNENNIVSSNDKEKPIKKENKLKQMKKKQEIFKKISC